MRQEETKVAAFLDAGFQCLETIEIWMLELSKLKSIVNRPLMAARRNFEIQGMTSVDPESWWDSCRDGDRPHMRFRLVDRKLRATCGQIEYWATRPIEVGWEQALLGLGVFEISDGYRDEGVVSCFLLDTLKRLAKEGFVQVEAQLDSEETCVRPHLEKLGFQLMGEAQQMSFDLPTSRLLRTGIVASFERGFERDTQCSCLDLHPPSTGDTQ